MIIVCPCVTYKCCKQNNAPTSHASHYKPVGSAPFAAGANQGTTVYAPGTVHGIYAQQQPFQGGYPQYPQHTFQGQPQFAQQHQHLNGHQNLTITPTAPPVAQAVPIQR